MDRCRGVDAAGGHRHGGLRQLDVRVVTQGSTPHARLCCAEWSCGRVCVNARMYACACMCPLFACISARWCSFVWHQLARFLSKHLGSRTEEQCAQHYWKQYLKAPTAPLPNLLPLPPFGVGAPGTTKPTTTSGGGSRAGASRGGGAGPAGAGGGGGGSGAEAVPAEVSCRGRGGGGAVIPVVCRAFRMTCSFVVPLSPGLPWSWNVEFTFVPLDAVSCGWGISAAFPIPPSSHMYGGGGGSHTCQLTGICDGMQLATLSCCGAPELGGRIHVCEVLDYPLG